MKEEIFSKFKDYNKELEKILEKKDFSKDTKNLLLSMFYKLEISYNDYFIVKRKCKTKQEYLENILNNIKQCNNIELIRPSDIEFENLKEKLYEVDLKLKKIKVIANETALLSAILELNNFQIFLPEEHNLVRNSMPYILNTAYDMENIEVLRDFNAWSWNTLVTEIKNIDINLVYQNLKILLNENIFDNIQKDNTCNDIIQVIEEELFQNYGKENGEKFIRIIYKISILIYINISEIEKKRLLEEKQNIEKELLEIKDKKLYIEKITKEKKNLSKELKNVDLIINNKDLLLKEYEKRNQLLSEYHKIFSISHLVEKLQKERKKILEKIELYNKKIEPKTYLEDKSKLQKDFELLKDIKFDKLNNIDKYKNKLQKLFLKELYVKRIEDLTNKTDIIDCLYELRYYNFIHYNPELLIKDIEEFKQDIKNLEEKMVKKLYDYKMINTISTNEKNDIEIVCNIFNLRIINLEYIYLEIRKKENVYILKIYDEKETLEKEIEIELEFNKKDKIKLNKKIKLFRFER